MKKVLLINPRSDNINTSVPLSLACLGAQLANHKYNVKVMDLSAPYISLSNEDVLNQIIAFNPSVVAITIMTPFVKNAYELIKEIKQKGLFIIAGGAHPTILPEETLRHGADMVIRNEGDITLIELLDAHFSEKNYDDVAGISYIHNDSIVHNQDRNYIENLDILPYPNKDLFEPSWYNEEGIPTNESYGTIVTSRGCPGRCTFCSRAVFQNKVRYNSPEYVINYMLFLKEKCGINRFYFLDDNCTTNKNRLLKICELIKEKLPNITWACTSRITNVNYDLLKMMVYSGCTTITYGVESGSNNTLQRINKNLTVDQISSTVKMSYALGMDVCANWMLGYPFESKQDINDTKKLVLELDPYIAMHNAGYIIPFPSTELYEEYKYLDSVKEYWLK